MPLLFQNQTFLVSSHVLASTVHALEQHGGIVVRHFNTNVTCGVAADSSSKHDTLEEKFPSALYFRVLRLPVVYETWVHACVAAQVLLPCRNLCPVESFLATFAIPEEALSSSAEESDGEAETEETQSHLAAQEKQWRDTLHDVLENVCGLSRATAATGLVAYDPLLLDGVEFTTTQLPLSLKANVVAALQFLGACYSPDLTTRTRLVVYSGVARPALASRGVNVLPSCGEPVGSESVTIEKRLAVPTQDAQVPHTPLRSSSCSSSCTSSSSSSSPAAVGAAGATKTPQPPQHQHEDEREKENGFLCPTRGSDATRGQSALRTRSPRPPLPQSKLAVASALGMLCVTPSWVQSCRSSGAFPGSSCLFTHTDSSTLSTPGISPTPTRTSPSGSCKESGAAAVPAARALRKRQRVNMS